MVDTTVYAQILKTRIVQHKLMKYVMGKKFCLVSKHTQWNTTNTIGEHSATKTLNGNIGWMQ